MPKKERLKPCVMESSSSPFPFDWSNVPQRLRTKRKKKFNGKEALSRPKKAHARPKEAPYRPKEAPSRPKETLCRLNEKLDSGIFDTFLK